MKITKFGLVVVARTAGCPSLVCLIHPYASILSKCTSFCFSFLHGSVSSALDIRNGILDIHFFMKITNDWNEEEMIRETILFMFNSSACRTCGDYRNLFSLPQLYVWDDSEYLPCKKRGCSTVVWTHHG
ncbi:hypothetical protein SADUNF_Sadunf02G0072400 [Salix dunnii]|uniref:Uncharacterized protein n=1 Tax=Salix dunnii TaxID=1413687 RepID=A0A835N6M2_9ROSI|nr:hypothetical protein SADUNF_Sadunf02G0072400 [Salix dunnii]